MRLRLDTAGFGLLLCLAVVVGSSQEHATFMDAVAKARSRLPGPNDVRSGAAGAIRKLTAQRAKRSRRNRWPLDHSKLVGSAFIDDGSVNDAPTAEYYHSLAQLDAEERAAMPGDLQLLEHFTKRLAHLSGHISSYSTEAERVAALHASGPIFLQLKHMASSKHLSLLAAKGPMESVSPKGWSRGDMDGRCFSCMYLMQKAVHDNSPVNSRESTFWGVRDIVGDAHRIGTAPNGVPVGFPSKSAYMLKTISGIENSASFHKSVHEDTAPVLHFTDGDDHDQHGEDRELGGSGGFDDGEQDGSNDEPGEPGEDEIDEEGSGGKQKDGAIDEDRAEHRAGGDNEDEAGDEADGDEKDEDGDAADEDDEAGDEADGDEKDEDGDAADEDKEDEDGDAADEDDEAGDEADEDKEDEDGDAADEYVEDGDASGEDKEEEDGDATDGSKDEEANHDAADAGEEDTADGGHGSRPVDAVSFLQRMAGDALASSIAAGETPTEVYNLYNERPPVGPHVYPPIPGPVAAGPSNLGVPLEQQSPNAVWEGKPIHIFPPAPPVLSLPQVQDFPPGVAPQGLVNKLQGHPMPQPPVMYPYMPGQDNAPAANMGMLMHPLPGVADLHVRDVDMAPAVPPPPPGLSLLQAGASTKLTPGVAGPFDDPRPSSWGWRPNPTSDQPGAGLAERPSIASNGMFGGLSTAARSRKKSELALKKLSTQLKLAREGSNEAESIELAIRKAGLMSAQRRFSAQAPAAALRHKEKVPKGWPPFGPAWGGGDAAERFDPPRALNQVQKHMEKYHGKVPSRLQKVKPHDLPLGFVPTSPEVGLFDEPAIVQDTQASRPKILDKGRAASHASAGTSSNGMALLQSGASGESALLASSAGLPSKAVSRSPRFAGTRAAAEFDVGAIGGGMSGMRERYRPLPHSCRSGEKLCRQRLRVLSAYALRRKIRRMKMGQQLNQLWRSWEHSVDRMCGEAPMGQPLPPQGEEVNRGVPAGVQDLKSELARTLDILDKEKDTFSKFVGTVDVAKLLKGKDVPKLATVALSHGGGSPMGSAMKALGRKSFSMLGDIGAFSGALGAKEKAPDVRKLRKTIEAMDAFHRALEAAKKGAKAKLALEEAASLESSNQTLGDDDERVQLLRSKAVKLLGELASLTRYLSPFRGVRAKQQAFDEVMDSGYEGMRPPPRLESEGLNGMGKAVPNPYTAWVTEPNRYGDRAAIGQLTDLGTPALVRKYCGDLRKNLELMADLFLHGYDLQEMCTIAQMCVPKTFNVITNDLPTSVKAATYDTLI